MSKKKKKVISICVAILVMILIAGVFLYIYFKPYINAIKIVDELISENYSYEIECYIEGVTLGQGKYGQQTVYITGEKYNESLRSYIFSQEEAYLEVFANMDGDVLFNLKPTCQFISNRLEEVLDISVGNLVIDIDDTYLSIDNVEEIIGLDIISPDDFGVENSFSKEKNYSIKRIDNPDDFNIDYDGEENYFFQLTLDDYYTKVIIGLPKGIAEKNIYIKMEKDDIILEMLVAYDMSEVIKTEFPTETFDDKQIESFKAAYKMWLIGKEAYDNIIDSEE